MKLANEKPVYHICPTIKFQNITEPKIIQQQCHHTNLMQLIRKPRITHLEGKQKCLK